MLNNSWFKKERPLQGLLGSGGGLAVGGGGGPVDATGGTETSYSDPTGQNWTVHTFTSSGSLVVSNAGPGDYGIDYLLIAGGGGGGGAGGGGAGGVIYKTDAPITAATFPVTIGEGGAAITSTGSATPGGNTGANSVFALTSPVTALAGGAGAGWETDGGEPGGSGGGAGASDNPGTHGTGTGYSHPGGVDAETPAPIITAGGWGYPGGEGAPNSNPGASAYYGGGGGGAGGEGGDYPLTPPTVSGPGGVGVKYTILTGNPTTGHFWAGGGGGGNQNSTTAGGGGSGGGGGGGIPDAGGTGGAAPSPGDPNFPDYASGEAGTDTTPGPSDWGYGGNAGTNSGGGGGGMAISVGHGGAGGDGILIVRYKT